MKQHINSVVMLIFIFVTYFVFIPMIANMYQKQIEIEHGKFEAMVNRIEGQQKANQIIFDELTKIKELGKNNQNLLESIQKEAK